MPERLLTDEEVMRLNRPGAVRPGLLSDEALAGEFAPRSAATPTEEPGLPARLVRSAVEAGRSMVGQMGREGPAMMHAIGRRAAEGGETLLRAQTLYQRLLGGLLGVPGVPMPSAEELEELAVIGTDALHEVASLGSGVKLGQKAEEVVQGILRFAGRGGRGRQEALDEIERLRPPKQKEPQFSSIRERDAYRKAQERAATREVIGSIARTAAFGEGLTTTTQLTPLPDITPGLGLTAAILMRLRPATMHLLVRNPTFARWALSTGAAPGGIGGKLGGLAMLAAMEGGEFQEAVREYINEAGRAEQ